MQIQATVSAAQRAEAATVAAIEQAAEQLDQVARNPIQDALDQLGRSIDAVKSRLEDARSQAGHMLLGALASFESFADDLAAPAIMHTPEAQPGPQAERLATTAALLSVMADRQEEQQVAIAALPASTPTPAAPLTEVQEEESQSEPPVAPPIQDALDQLVRSMAAVQVRYPEARVRLVRKGRAKATKVVHDGHGKDLGEECGTETAAWRSALAAISD